MTELKMTETLQSEPAPTRPTWKTAAGVAFVIVAYQVSAHWPEITTFAHFS